MNSPNPLRKPFRYSYFNVTLVLIVINVAVFFLNLVSPTTKLYLALIPQLVYQRGFYWQILTYMFVHGSYMHIFFNMLGLFMFGIQLERRMGSVEFLVLYLFTGIGTGLFSLFLGMNVVGASGAIYALLLAFATFFPSSRILLFFIPVPAPLAVALFAVMSIIFQFTGAMGGIAHLAHLAGLVLGYIYFVVRLGINPIRVFLERR